MFALSFDVTCEFEMRATSYGVLSLRLDCETKFGAKPTPRAERIYYGCAIDSKPCTATERSDGVFASDSDYKTKPHGDN